MPADRLLSTLLRSLQTYTEHQDTPRLLGTAVSLLCSLNNPLNVTLLTSQLLIAPAIWSKPDGLRTHLSFMGVFHSAARRFIEREQNARTGNRPLPASLTLDSHLSVEEWTLAVIKGADEHSQPANHLLVLGGLLIGFSSYDDDFHSSHLGMTLQSAFVKATNLALLETPFSDELSQCGIVLAINHAFTHLSDMERSKIDYDRLLPIMMNSMLHSVEGLRSGYFLGAADVDVQQVSSKLFNWAKSSNSARLIENIVSSPLCSNLGPLSRLMAHTVENVQNSWLVVSAVEDFADFSRRLLMQWRQNKLSEIDPSEETEFLHEEARRDTLPPMWRLLRSTLFAIVIVLRSVVGRVIGDSVLASDDNAPHVAQEILHTLRGLSFIHTRLGSAAFSQYTFTYLATIDILATYPPDVEAFLQSIAPAELGNIPRHPLERALDLFFLNTTEQFALVISPQLGEDLVVAAATPYLVTGGNPILLPIFEAAHSIMLAVFSSPQNVEITAKHLPFYVDALFRVFPHNLSPRQFRLAFTNLVRITSPPSKIAAAQPMLAAILLEIAHERAMHAPSEPLPLNLAITPITSPLAGPENTVVPQMSEQGVLISTLTDSLPSLALELLEEWLTLTTSLINIISDAPMRDYCKKHFWDILVGGEMDPERSQVCVIWWSSKGGREMLLYGDENPPKPAGSQHMMSGALPDESPAAKL